MSVLIVSKINEEVVLATDSRLVDMKGRVHSDSQQKIFEIAPNTFFAASGLLATVLSQARMAEELARSVGLSNPTEFADQLDRASQHLMRDVIAHAQAMSPLREDYRNVVNGGTVYCYVLAGITDGCAWFILREFKCVNGQAKCFETSAFKLPAGNNFRMGNTRGELTEHLVLDHATWERGIVPGVQFLVNHVCSRHAECGGPTQMVSLVPTGARWVHRPPVIDSCLHASISAGGVLIYSGDFQGPSITSPSITGGSLTITGPGSTSTITSTQDGLQCHGSGSFSTYVGNYGYNVCSVAQGVNISMMTPISLQIAGVSVVDSTGAYIGPGLKPTISGTQYTGGTFTFQDLSGVTHTVKGGVLIS